MSKKSIISGLVSLALIGITYLLYSKITKTPSLKKTHKQTNTNHKSEERINRDQLNILSIEPSTIELNINLQGICKASKSIRIVSEVSGIFKHKSKEFKEGIHFNKGELLLGIDQEKSTLELQKKRQDFYDKILGILPDLAFDFKQAHQQYESYLKQIKIDKTLAELPKIQNNEAQYFITAKGIPSMFLQIKTAEQQQKKYRITAAFSGVLTKVNTNFGEFIQQGKELARLIAPDNYEIELKIPLSKTTSIRKGQKITLYTDYNTQTYTAKIKRINQSINKENQTLSVFAYIKETSLKEGMFVNATLHYKTIENAVNIPRNLVDNKKFIFVLNNENKITRKEIDILAYDNDNAIIESKIPIKIINQPNAKTLEGKTLDTKTIDYEITD